MLTCRDAKSAEVLYRDNFTGAGFRRVLTAERQEGGCVVVLFADGTIAQDPIGTAWNPVEFATGRNFGTDSDRAYIILRNAKKHHRPDESYERERSKIKLNWVLIVLGAPIVLIALGHFFGR